MDYRPTTIESNERRARDAFAIVLVLLSLILLPIAWPLYFVCRSYWLRARGFWVTREGRDAIEYQELHNGRVERLTIGGEMMIGAPHLIYVPTEEEWRRTMPEWAQERREEIVANVKSKLGTKRYEYDYS
jgi:hypothetical protein